jgi:hypothetical protein
MFSNTTFRLPSIAALAIVCQLFAVAECDAQQNEQSLFVIKTPSVEKSGYGQRPAAINATPISYQAQESTPREDEGPEPVPDEPNLSDLEGLDANEDLDIDEDDDRLLDDDMEDEEPAAREMTQWNLKPISSIVPSLRLANGKSPADQSWQLTSRNSAPIGNSDKLFAWAAPNISYKPLYFEDVALERYGQTKGLFRQPFVSGIHYLKSAAMLPYFSLYDPVNSCDGPLGYCRPGQKVNCVTQKHYFGNPFNRGR